MSQVKEDAAKAALKIVFQLAKAQNDLIGLGTGSTADPFTRFLAAAFHAGDLVNRPVCTSSYPTATLCQELGLNVLQAIPTNGLRVTVDGADEIELSSGAVIKGGGAAAIAEKALARAALQHGGEFIVIVDESKLTKTVLGSTFIYGVPVHIRPEARFIVKKQLENLFSVQVSLREALVRQDLATSATIQAGKAGCYGPLTSREGDLILDVRFNGAIPLDFNEKALALPGVTGTGLFANEDSPTRVIVAGRHGVKEYITPHGVTKGLKPLLN